jgi:hypothetical protein
MFDLLGVRQKIEEHGFTKKQGAYLVWGTNPDPWTIEFGELTGQHSYAFQVIRSEFDHLLLNHSHASGV